MTRFILARAEPTPEMLVAAIEGFTGSDTDVRDMIHADEIAASYRAAIAASPALTPAEVDGLCRAMWGHYLHWRISDKHATATHFAQRKSQRALMLAFIAALATLENPNG